MAKSKSASQGASHNAPLFRTVASTRRRTLILPRYLQEEAIKPVNQGSDVDAAHQVFVRWADLESDGHLAQNETELDDSFRQEIFGQTLRYATATSSPTDYHYHKGFFVPGADHRNRKRERPGRL